MDDGVGAGDDRGDEQGGVRVGGVDDDGRGGDGGLDLAADAKAVLAVEVVVEEYDVRGGAVSSGSRSAEAGRRSDGHQAGF